MKQKRRIVLSFLSVILGVTLCVIYFFSQKNDQYFTFVVLPDTQKYSMYYPDTFFSQTAWIVKNRKRLHIAFVSQLGDLVQSGALERSEWQTASDALSYLDRANVPYGIIPGNHDVDRVDDPTSGFTIFNTIFPISRYAKNPWFGGNMNGMQNNYQLITADMTPFIIMNVEVDPSDEVLAWASSVLSKYPNRKAIVTTHAYLRDDTGLRSRDPHFRINGNSGEGIWNKLIKNNCNVFLVLSGHFHESDGENRLTSTNSCGGNVYQIVQDYQDRDKGGDGLLRLYTYYPEQHTLSVSTFSTVRNRYERDRNSTFDLPLPF